MRPHDLIVAGAGIVGAACAQAAAEAGLRVVVVEPGVVGGGATAAGMGHLVALDGVPAEFALARDSLRLWEAYAERPEAEFHRCGTLWVADDDAGLQTLRDKTARLGAAGVAVEWLDAAALREAEPALAHDLVAGLRVPGEAVVYPPRVARTMLDRVGMLGGTLIQGRKVVALENDGVRLDDDTRLHGPVLVACGCDTPALLPELAMRPRRGHLVITDRYPGWLRHQVVETGYAASAHGTAGEAVACNVQPRPGGQLLVGSSREFGPVGTQVVASLLARMLRRCFRFLPELARLKALRAWTGFRPATPDGLPYIGALPSRPGVWVAAGHEGLGVTTALGTAQLFADLFLGRAPRIDPAPYAPLRGPA
jgi:glycine/D-amino acid oxidase-like deaminating enzyme